MTKRNTALMLAVAAGYHADSGAFLRLLVESRINRQTMNRAWNAGAGAKLRGVPCDCSDCKRGAK